MVMLPSVFNTSEAPDDAFAPIPAGWYDAVITKTEMKDTKDKTGKYLAITHQISSGPRKGRLIFCNLNLVNKNAMTVQIANADLKKICAACDIETLEDSVDLHGIPICLKVTLKPETSQWPAGNECKGWKAEGEMETDSDPGDDSDPFGE